ncbi:MAG TPA: preprotein translocase subunit SecA, partial [Segeticoccus sp.]|nr:preprotein translocase subunit SecA [Segeticoccus sp.]
FMSTAKMEDEVPIESKMVSRSIASAQAQVEGQNYEMRKNVLKYDDVLNRQREVIYEERRRVLEGEDLEDQIRLFINDVITSYIDAATADGFAEDWDLEQLWVALKQLYPVSFTLAEFEEAAGGRTSITAEMLSSEVMSDAQHAYDAREEELGEDVMREVERRVVLSVLDRKWREHLYEMDYLKEGIGLRAMAQKDPVVEYQREGFNLFEAMNEAIKEESVAYLFNVEINVEEAQAAVAAQPEASADGQPVAVGQSDGQDDGQPTGQPAGAPVGAGQAEEPELQPVGAAAARQAPVIHGKGLDEQPQARGLSYSSPSEDGSVQVRSMDGDGSGGARTARPNDGMSRKERRKAQRQAKKKR